MTAPKFVWIPDIEEGGTGRYGRLISFGAYASQVEFSEEGMLYQITISNDDFEYFGEPDNDED